MIFWIKYQAIRNMYECSSIFKTKADEVRKEIVMKNNNAEK